MVVVGAEYTSGRIRLSPSTKWAASRIAVTQIRLPGLGRTYYRKRAAGGDSNTEALRCLKRRLARIVFQAPSHRPRAATHALPNGGGLT